MTSSKMTARALFNLKEKVAVVTGGTGYLGKSIAEGLAEMGAHVFITSRYEDKALIKRAKKASDKVFLCAMRDAEPAVPSWKRYAAYYAVAAFGRWSIIPNKDNI